MPPSPRIYVPPTSAALSNSATESAITTRTTIRIRWWHSSIYPTVSREPSCFDPPVLVRRRPWRTG